MAKALDTKKDNSLYTLPETPRLLSESKSTYAALALLEKAIKLIHDRDFKKARMELSSLIDGYPQETEILARARSYLHICDREEGARKKPSVTEDQVYALGVLEHNRGEYKQAIDHFRQSLDTNPDSDYIYYSLAASLAMKRETAEAIKTLRKAIELNEDNRIYAKNDSDFTSLHGHKEFTELVGMNPAADEQTQS